MNQGKPSFLYRFAPTRLLMGRLLREHVRHYTGDLILALLMMLVIAACTAFFAKLIEPILDRVFIGKDSAALWPVGFAVLGVFTLRAAASYGEAMLMSRIGQGIIRDMQDRLFRHIIHADLAYFQGSSIGSLISRFTYDVNMLRHAVSNTIVGMGKDVLTLVFLVGLLFYQDWKLAAVALVVLPLTAFPINKLGRKMRKVSFGVQDLAGFYTSLLEQVFHGMRHVKANNAEDSEAERAAQMTQQIYKLSQKGQKVRALSSPIMEVFGAVAIFSVIVYGGYQVIGGHKTAGAFFSFITALLLAYEPLKGIAKLNAGLQEGLAAAGRIFESLEIMPNIVDTPGATDLRLEKGAIRFDNVGFSYGNGGEALSNLTLDIPAGKTIALVGASGGGKTTILNLIPRFYDVQQGTISIDGQDIRKVTLQSLRSRIALVSQETLLFDDTVRANIAYGQRGASEQDIAAAAQAAGAHDFILSLPQGYDTVVGAQGANLSGGQRQRIAIARAILKNAPILLLDEATSALDAQTERQVQAALKKLMQGRTTVVIAHRLSTIMDADIIYVIDKGRVVESGSHAALMLKSGLYADLCRLQFHSEGGNSAPRAILA